MTTQALEPFKVIAQYIGELMGDHDYQKYCEHLRIHHPDQPIPSECKYWRRRHSDAEANLQSRCYQSKLGLAPRV